MQAHQADMSRPATRLTAAQVADTLASIGPIRDLVVAPIASHQGPGGSPEARGNALLLAAVGSGKQGALAVLRQGVVPHAITEVPLKGEHYCLIGHLPWAANRVCSPVAAKCQAVVGQSS